MTMAGWAAAILLSGVLADEPKSCFDWAVVGELKRQVFLGVPASDEGQISIDGVFEWTIAVQQVVAGKGVPSRLRLGVSHHTGLPRRYWDGIVLFVRKEPGKRPLLVRWAPLDQDLAREAWPGAVGEQAAAFGLQRCTD